MDDLQFDAWTRRRFGIAAGGIAAAFLGLTTIDSANAKNKRKRKKKKCKKSEKRCGKKCVKGTCCPGKSCGEDCECGRTVEGRGFCFAKVLNICAQCTSSAECEEGSQCVQIDPPCGEVTAVCKPPCGFDPSRS